MKREMIIQMISEIKSGRTFYRSSFPKTMHYKRLWDELKSEVIYGYSIDIPLKRSA